RPWSAPSRGWPWGGPPRGRPWGGSSSRGRPLGRASPRGGASGVRLPGALLKPLMGWNPAWRRCSRGGQVAGRGRAAPAPARPAGRRQRLSDVAAHAGVSSGLVSLVLRNQPGPSAQTRERVIAAAQELGYRADRTASLLARRRSRHLGVLMDVRNTFHAEL